MNKKPIRNRRIIAAQLRRRATRIDRSAWWVERATPQKQSAPLVKALRDDARALRRIAEQLAPKK